jgi:hypothetical protein
LIAEFVVMPCSLLLASHREADRTDLLERRLRRFHPRCRDAVRVLAERHARIADLAVSFPALLFALAVPRRGLDPARALACVIDGRPLAEVSAAADVPMWLRKLPAEAFCGPIPKLPDGDLFRRQIANHLPRSPKLAPAWLQVVAQAVELAHAPAAIWIAREFVRATPPRVNFARLRLIALWSWFSVQPATLGHQLIDKPWTPDMGMDQALGAADDWRMIVALHLNLGRQPIADMWLDAGQVAGYDFVPLSSIAAIVEEAAVMKNCLRTYGYNLAHNRSRLWSVRRHGERVATLKVACAFRDPLPMIVELKGPGNADVPRELSWAARKWLHMHDLSRVDMVQRKWGTAPLDRALWLSLWRPYWLAGRRIPEWLPIAPSRAALEAL